MIAVPSPTAVTRPLSSTVATLSSLEVQVMSLLVAVEGLTVAFRALVGASSPIIVIFTLVAFRLSLLTGVGALMVMVLVWVFFVTLLERVTFTVPAFRRLSSPSAEISASPVTLVTVQMASASSYPSASSTYSGPMFAVNCTSEPSM